jgi:glycosyltransferase involved in cell wall biosynthesis
VLARRYGLPAERTIRVVHPRSQEPEPRRRETDPSGVVDLGFFGTVRPHKGIRAIAAVIEADPDFRLHLFAGYDPAGLESVKRQIVEHPADGSRAQEAASVDAVLLPQKRTPASEIQTPSKLIDAMRFGVPAFVTPTEAIREVGGDTLHYLHAWDDPVAVGKTIRRLLAEDGSSGTRAKERFDSELSIEAMAPRMAEFLEALEPQIEAPPRRRLAASASASR